MKSKNYINRFFLCGMELKKKKNEYFPEKLYKEKSTILDDFV